MNRKCFTGGYSEEATGYRVEDLRCNTYEKMLEKVIASNAADPKRQDTKLNNSNKKDCSIVAQQRVSNTNSLLVRVGRITCSSALRSTCNA